MKDNNKDRDKMALPVADMMKKVMVEQNKALSGITALARAQTETINKFMAKMRMQWIGIAESVNKLFKPLMLPWVGKIQEWARLEDISVCFREGGVWLTPSMSLALVNEVLARYKQGKKSTIPSLIDGYYRKNKYESLRQAVHSWESMDFFEYRMHIINDALEAHCARKWTLSIPSLLPIIEGITREFLLKQGVTVSRETRASLQVDGGAENYTSYLFANLSASEVTPTMDVIISSLLYYLEGTLYISSDFNKDVEKIKRWKTLNRHAILHGVQVKYPSRLNSLKCFMLLDSLSVLVGSIPKLV